MLKFLVFPYCVCPTTVGTDVSDYYSYVLRYILLWTTTAPPALVSNDDNDDNAHTHTHICTVTTTTKHTSYLRYIPTHTQTIPNTIHTTHQA